MSDRIEALVKEIAAKHGIAVGRDDPIMILQTINERLIQDSAAAQQDALDRFKEELESIAHRWGEDARAKAERTLTTALAAGRAAMSKDMQAGAKAAA
nr:conjugal transfer protein TraM [Xanthomonadales bacterium]